MGNEEEMDRMYVAVERWLNTLTPEELEALKVELRRMGPTNAEKERRAS